eukprot:m.13641 g.13641  ORF g.13641 m.13641 type:complete len:349 (-) comp8191_c0_seq1:179-1225(-)
MGTARRVPTGCYGEECSTMQSSGHACCGGRVRAAVSRSALPRARRSHCNRGPPGVAVLSVLWVVLAWSTIAQGQQPTATPTAAPMTVAPTPAVSGDRLSTAEVVGICLSANIVGILLVVGSLWYNSRYPQYGTNETRKAVTQLYSAPHPTSTSTTASSTQYANHIGGSQYDTTTDGYAQGYIGVGGSDDPKSRPESHQYAEIGEQAVAPHDSLKGSGITTQPNEYASLPLDGPRVPAPTSDVFSGFEEGIAGDGAMPSPPNPPDVPPPGVVVMSAGAYGTKDPSPVPTVKTMASGGSTRASRSSRSSRSSTSSRSKRGSKKMTKLDISGPSDFQHKGHIGIDDTSMAP